MKRMSVWTGMVLLSVATGCTSTVFYTGEGPIAIKGEARELLKLDKKAIKAKMSAKKIEIDDKVQFEVNQAIIKSESHQLLNDVAQVMKEHPEITKLRVEGHASADGDDNQNLKLSDSRAKAVVAYLISQGIEEKRLVGQGFGEKQPIADNNTEEGREKNRRVEFNIAEKDGKPIEDKK